MTKSSSVGRGQMYEPLRATLKMKFRQQESLFRDTLASVTGPKQWFASDEFPRLSDEALEIFVRTQPLCTMLVDAAKGQMERSHIDSQIGRGFCFTAKFVKQPSTASLPMPLWLPLESILEESFDLGLLCHLFLTKHPERASGENIDLDAIMRKCVPNVLVADRLLREYSADLNNLPLRIYESYYSTRIKGFMRDELRLGFWKLGKCHSYFRNLFFSGAFVGVQYDLQTRSTQK